MFKMIKKIIQVNESEFSFNFLKDQNINNYDFILKNNNYRVTNLKSLRIKEKFLKNGSKVYLEKRKLLKDFKGYQSFD